MATPALRVNGVNFADGSSLGLSASGQAVIRYNNSTHVIEQSVNGGAYTTIGSGGGGGSLQADYTAGGAGGGVIGLSASGGGIIIRDNATPIGGNLLAVQNSAGTQTYFAVTASASGSTAITLNDGSSSGLSAANTATIIYNNTTHQIQVSANGGAYSNIGSAALGNWTFSGNIADLSGAGAMQLGNGTATSVAFAPTAVNFAANTILGLSAQAATNTTGITLKSNVADGASSNAVDVVNATTLVSPGSAMMRFINNATLKGQIKFYSGSNTIFGWQANGDTMFVDNLNNGFTIQGGSTFFYANSGVAQVSVGNGFLRPQTDNTPSCGDSTHRWTQVWAYAHCGVEQTIAAAASVTVNPASGENIRITLSATAITSLTVSSGSVGQCLKVHVIQDATGSRSIPTTWTNVRFPGGTYTASTGANKVDVIDLAWNNTDSKWDAMVSLNLS